MFCANLETIATSSAVAELDRIGIDVFWGEWCENNKIYIISDQPVHEIETYEEWRFSK